jgi:hypothetical protein
LAPPRYYNLINVEPGASIIPPPKAARLSYCPNLLEGAFSELRAEGVLGS